MILNAGPFTPTVTLTFTAAPSLDAEGDEVSVVDAAEPTLSTALKLGDCWLISPGCVVMSDPNIELSSCETAVEAVAFAADSLVWPATLTLPPVVVSWPLKALPGLVNCMVPVPAAMSVVPVTVSGPSCVTLPLPLLAARLPPTLDVPRSNAPEETTLRLPLAATVPKARDPASVRLTFEPEVVTLPPKALPIFFNSMLPLPAMMLVVPVTASGPSCVTLPLPLLAARLPPTVEVPKSSAPVDARVRLPVAATVPKVRGPASVRRIAVPEALTACAKVLAAQQI